MQPGAARQSGPMLRRKTSLIADVVPQQSLTAILHRTSKAAPEVLAGLAEVTVTCCRGMTARRQ